MAAAVVPTPPGLAVGVMVPPFKLPDLAGQEVALAELRGGRVLLVHWNPDCGYCEVVAPELARLQDDLAERKVTLLLLSHGSPEANRSMAEENGLKVPILLATEGTIGPRLFEGMGTPVAYLLDREGRVEQPLAIGLEGVQDLARQIAGESKRRIRLPGEKPLSHSKLERNGLKAGTRAPSFALPGLDGGIITLESYRGRRLLLVFTDPHCGPCDRLAPELVGWHRESAGDPALLLVGRGDLEANRRKAELLDNALRIVVQKRWEISKEYGIFMTPAAFLIDENGVIARNVAKGLDEIMALALDGSPAGMRLG